tara:strand:- start:59 stop:694 length:636 start_codon:yes stop_codon:yes gene_type:complete
MSNWFDRFIEKWVGDTLQKKTMILDPLTTMFRLSMLSFKPLGTKLSVYKNTMNYVEPGAFQGVYRWTFGEGRDDLHNIYRPIQKFLNWYSREDETISKLIDFSIQGLQKLSESYAQDSIIHHSIKLYILMLENNKPMEDEHEEKEVNNQIYESFKGLYEKNEINLLVGMLELAKREQDQEKVNSFLKSIDTLLLVKERRIHSIVVDSSTIL